MSLYCQNCDHLRAENALLQAQLATAELLQAFYLEGLNKSADELATAKEEIERQKGTCMCMDCGKTIRTVEQSNHDKICKVAMKGEYAMGKEKRNPYEYCKKHRTIAVKTTAGCPFCLQAELATAKQENKRLQAAVGLALVLDDVDSIKEVLHPWSKP